MTGWILGRSIDSNYQDALDISENFIGYLVHLEYPRCMVAVGNLELLNEREAFDLPADAGLFYANESKGYSLVLLEWLDDPVKDANDVAALMFSAASHYNIVLEDNMEETLEEMEGVL